MHMQGWLTRLCSPPWFDTAHAALLSYCCICTQSTLALFILLTYLFCPSTVLPVAKACFSPFKSPPPNYLSHFLLSHAKDTQWLIMTPQTASIRHSAIDSSLSFSRRFPLLLAWSRPSFFLFSHSPPLLSFCFSVIVRRPPPHHRPNATCRGAEMHHPNVLFYGNAAHLSSLLLLINKNMSTPFFKKWSRIVQAQPKYISGLCVEV